MSGDNVSSNSTYSTEEMKATAIKCLSTEGLTSIEGNNHKIGCLLAHPDMLLYASNRVDELEQALKELVSIVNIHQDVTKNKFAWAELEEANKVLECE